MLVVRLDDAALPALIAPLNHILFTTSEEVCAVIADLFTPPAESALSLQASHGDDHRSVCSWDSLDDAHLDTLLANIGSLRQQPHPETTLRVEMRRRLAYDLTEKLSELNTSRATLNSQLSVIVPALACHGADKQQRKDDGR